MVVFRQIGENFKIVRDPRNPFHGQPVAVDGRRGAQGQTEHGAHDHFLFCSCNKYYLNNLDNGLLNMDMNFHDYFSIKWKVNVNYNCAYDKNVSIPRMYIKG